MDPVNQSAQISSSGFADGHNSAAKESKLSDSFLSSSPVSLIQSPQDKRIVLGSDKSCEGVATSLRFPSQSGSFTPSHYGKEAGPPDGQPDSPIKASPVSERIKALEALAAKKKESDFRSDGSFSHYKERNYEKSPTEVHKSPVEKITPSVQIKRSSTDQSPESPFEVLGDLRQVNEFEETEEWMKAHLPPVPKLDGVDLIKDTLASDNVSSKEKNTDIVTPDAFAGVPEAFMDFEAPIVKDDCDAKKQSIVEEEFDLSFLPTAYMWDQQDKSGAQAQANTESNLSASPAPPAGFGSPSPPCSPPDSVDVAHRVLGDEKPTLTGDLEHPEANEAESSGESDETVIEDGVTVPVSSQSSEPVVSNGSTPASATPDVPSEITPPPKSERKLMQVPTINVIETDEPNYSEEEMEMELEADEDEDSEVIKDSSREAPKTSETEPDDCINTPPKARPLETEFVEGYSPPSSPVDSDAEYSPKHKLFKCLPETVSQEAIENPEPLPNPALSEDSASDVSQIQPEKSSTVNDEPSCFMGTNEEVDFPDNDNDWSDDGQCMGSSRINVGSKEPIPCIQAKVESTDEKEAYVEMASISKTSFMQDEIYDRQSFDYDFDAFSPLDNPDNKGMNNAKERFLSDANEIQTEKLNAGATRKFQEDTKTLDDFSLLNYDKDSPKQDAQTSVKEHSQDQFSLFQSETLTSVSEQDFTKKMTSDHTSDNMTNGNSSAAQKIDSAVQQDTQMAHHKPKIITSASTDTSSLTSGPTDSFVEFMRECLKSKQDDEADNLHQDVPSKTAICKTNLPPSQPTPTMVMDLEQEQLTISALKELGSNQKEEDPTPDNSSSNASSQQRSAFATVSNPPCSQSSRVYDGTYSKEVEAIDEWVAEAYHLAEHVLTAILTHLSVKDLIHWRDPKKSGVVFGLSMLMLLSLAAFSIISVVSYLLLALLCVTITFRIYKSVVQAVQKSSEGHPFKSLIDKDVSIPPETFRKHVDASLTYINRALKQMSRLFLVEDLVDSLKLAVVMWLLTYVGAVFNGITILILADILLFAVPPIYEKNKTQIDQYIDVARTQINTTIAKLQEKLPGAMKRSKTE
ncbi:reticulon-3 isoform X1 [Betta splendens]|uniref:Reticulon n=1 Tax=Betta splendens TaxID=158456 RepID=A0A6P7L4K7_BETSP|nr:reticulon-3 isoform X1 [Betta splendens]